MNTIISFLLYHTPLFYLIQSLWRDEAFSYFMSRPSIVQVIKNTASDFNPPLYYLLLHFWLTLGKSDELLRALSFLFHLGTTYISFRFGKKLFGTKFALFVALFTLFNPMLLYYAFELRMYSLYALAAMASIHFLFTRQWKKYIIATTAGLYTHSFFPLVVTSYLIIFRFIPHMRKRDGWKVASPLLLFLPWFFVLVNQFLRSGNSWIFPVDLQLVSSVLGNLFTSYEGTPGGLWQYTAYLSTGIIFFFVIFIARKRREAIVFLTPLFLPLILIIGYSIVRRPIYVNRYMIFVTVFEILALSYSIFLVRNKKMRTAVAGIWLLFVIVINFFIPPFHKKADFKLTFAELDKISKPDDFIYAKTPIGYLESAYYYTDEKRVFVYNPQNIAIPDYIGSNVVFPHASRSSFPPAPSRVFLIADNAQYELFIQQ